MSRNVACYRLADGVGLLGYSAIVSSRIVVAYWRFLAEKVDHAVGVGGVLRFYPGFVLGASETAVSHAQVLAN